MTDSKHHSIRRSRWPQGFNHADTMRAWARQFIERYIIEQAYWTCHLEISKHLNRGPMYCLPRWFMQ